MKGISRPWLRLCARNGDDSLKSHFKECGANATCTSWRTQNEIISACHCIILRKLVSKVKVAKCFAILADETAVIAGVEQLSICARYVEKIEIREEFLQFVPVSDLTRRGLVDTILKGLRTICIATEYLRAQGYDGAAPMSGAYNGVQALVQQQCANTIYVHCHSHSLNLSL